MARAGDASARIDRHLEAMRRSGGLREFNREYSVRRGQARASGHGFMSYAGATAQLRSAMIEHLIGTKPVDPVRSMFAQIFVD
jgi:hypothetical protein